ncbi:UvrD-helicase domain-containing protein [Rhodococcus fascians]|nr:UvrD-helicase domain-containing protein [Rhodococcus fascians]MBY3999481.1 UvrD-helicase domain-containing protein [Rhodococcus fascians]MBY4005014.1 UvrD-helicase domain-containing protein [Rhodococcus fascians]MBY4010113.1 UvrD-helicase domain-containing protein [Rhodococcus fascians]MBY4020221.1 UvrD-helicase domain-containing protein [Rhodococcus fascians]
MTFAPQNPQQKRVVETHAELTVVLGGAGVGKTTSALAAADAHLERVAESKTFDRVLFLSFSRSSVARIASRADEILGRRGSQVDIMTFHSLAFSVVRRFGSLVGRGDAILVSPAREKLVLAENEIGYSKLIPLSLEIAQAAPAVAEHLRTRWGLVIVDEFQDTGDAQQDLLQLVSRNSRVLLLGDPNQCIYTFLAADGVRVERIHEACSAAGAENTIVLPETSFRDPSGVIPAVANAIRERLFESEAVSTAIQDGRLVIRSGISRADETSNVTRTISELTSEGMGVAVFTHHNDMLAALSDALEAEGIEHEVAGLSDALAAALDAQAAMAQFYTGDVDWEGVLEALAVFLTSAQRGRQVPHLARQVIDGSGSVSLQDRLNSLRTRLSNSTSVRDVTEIAGTAHQALGLPQKSGAWQQAATLLSVMRMRAARRGRGRTDSRQLVAGMCAQAREASYAALTDSVLSPREVQLMNLYQTKGREADATVVVLREGDFMGYESEPFPNTSRLLYVVFSRARQRIVVLLVGDELHASVAPLIALSEL